MNKGTTILLTLIALFLVSVSHTEGSVNFPNYNSKEHKRILQAWLSEHPSYRIAVETDCTHCSDDLNRIRKQTIGVWKAMPNYQPYYIVGDFNSDKVIDFAVAVIDDRKMQDKFQILIFNGPFNTASPHKPSFTSESLDLSNSGMFYGSPRPKPWRLLVGPFESEGRSLIPQGTTYKWEEEE